MSIIWYSNETHWLVKYTLERFIKRYCQIACFTEKGELVIWILLSQITGKKSFSKDSNQADVLWYTRFSLAFSYSLPELTYSRNWTILLGTSCSYMGSLSDRLPFNQLFFSLRSADSKVGRNLLRRIVFISKTNKQTNKQNQPNRKAQKLLNSFWWFFTISEGQWWRQYCYHKDVGMFITQDVSRVSWDIRMMFSSPNISVQNEIRTKKKEKKKKKKGEKESLELVIFISRNRNYHESFLLLIIHQF